MILGESGTGKSASMRNFSPAELSIVNVAKKPLPFRNNGYEIYNSDNYSSITKFLKACESPSIVIDDCQYLMGNEFMRRSSERGYDKFTEIARNFWDLVQTVINDLPENTIVYFLSHIQRDDNGNEKVKTIGKLLDEKITVEGMFTIVLKTNVSDGVYSFLTQNSGHDTVKSPMGLFDAYAIDNDLHLVDQKIRNYYAMSGALSDEEVKEAEAAATVAVDKSETGRRGRRNRSESTPAERAAEAVKEAQEGAGRRGRREQTETHETPEPQSEQVEESKQEEQPEKRTRRRKDRTQVPPDTIEEQGAEIIGGSEDNDVPFY